MNLVDSSGWLEYLTDSKNAGFFAPAIEKSDELFVSTITVYEVFKKVLIERDEQAAIQVAALMHQAKVIEVDSVIAIQAAKFT